MKLKQPILDKLMARTDKTGACWLWLGPLNKHGYGQFPVNGKTSRVHRVAYSLLVGEISPSLVLDHLCHNADKTCVGGDTCLHRRCLNPDHLEVVTNRENTLRGRGLAAQNVKKTHCPRGHAYTPDNIYTNKPGTRWCRECARLREATRGKRIRPWMTAYKLLHPEPAQPHHNKEAA